MSLLAVALPARESLDVRVEDPGGGHRPWVGIMRIRLRMTDAD